MKAFTVVLIVSLLLLSRVDGKVDDIKLCVVPATVHVRQDDSCNSMSGITRDAVNWAGMRGEQEAIQIMVDGVTANMTNYLSVEFSDLTQQFGVGQIDKNTLRWWQVGYVNCKETTRYPGSGGGWRPDPLLMPTDNNNITLESNVTQPLWVTIHIPSTSIAGEYTGKIAISIQSNGAAMNTVIPIYLVVWNITLPELKSAKFSSAFSFDTSSLKNYYGNVSTMKFSYYNMLVDQRVANNDFYQAIPSPDEDYDYLFKAGVQYMGLVDVNSIQVTNNGGSEEQLRGVCKNYTDDEVNKIINYLEPYVEKYDKLGYLDNMFVYGFDEVAEDCVDSITKLFGGIKSKWPNITTMAAINFIPPTTLPVDIWVLQYEFYDKEKTLPWIKSGKKQWWYHCIEPANDAYLNSFIERPLMEIRLLYWLASSEPVDGWLYYAIDLWRRVPFSNTTLQRLDNTARTNFDPANYIWYPDTNIFANGDGYFIYPGPDGPIPTVRLHNFRDGFEDIELLRMLDSNTIQQLVQPLVRSPTNYTLDPYLLEQTRKKVAELIMK